MIKFNASVKEEVWIRDEGECWRCGRALELRDVSVDHLIPRHCGGEDLLDNVAASCWSCNHTRPMWPTNDVFRVIDQFGTFDINWTTTVRPVDFYISAQAVRAINDMKAAHDKLTEIQVWKKIPAVCELTAEGCEDLAWVLAKTDTWGLSL